MSSSLGTGVGSYIKVVKEVTYGTDPGSGYTANRIVTEGIRGDSSPTAGNRGLGRIGVRNIKHRLMRSAGDVVFDAEYEGLEEWLRNFFGGYVGTNDSPVVGARTHVFTPSVARAGSLTAQIHQEVKANIVKGLKTTSLKFGVSNENMILTFGTIGQVIATAVHDASPTFPSSDDIIPLTSGTPFTFKLDTVALDVRDAEVDFQLPHTEDREAVGSALMKEPALNGVMGISGSLSREYIDSAFVDDYIAKSVHRLDWTWTSDTDIVGATPYSLTLTIWEALFPQAKPGTDGPGVLQESIPFTAMVKADGTFATVTLVNGATVLT